MAPWKCFVMFALQSPLTYFACGLLGMQVTSLMLFLAHREIEWWAWMLVSVLNAIVLTVAVQRVVDWLARRHYLAHARLLEARKERE